LISDVRDLFAKHRAVDAGFIEELQSLLMKAGLDASLICDIIESITMREASYISKRAVRNIIKTVLATRLI